MTENLMLGKWYDRPHVRVIWPYAGSPRWIAVLGPHHEDGELLGFHHEHFHVDYRFLPADLRTEDYNNEHTLGGLGPFHAVFNMAVTLVAPALPDDHPLRQGQPYGYPRLPLHLALEREDIPLKSWYRTRRTKFKVPYPAYPGPVRWTSDIEAAYKDVQLRQGMICPHRGADLSGLEIKDGVVECPLHGLRWRVETGRMEPRGRQ